MTFNTTAVASSFPRYGLTPSSEVGQLALCEGHVHVESFPHEVMSIKRFHCVFSVSTILIFNEAKTSFQIDALDFAIFAEEIMHISLAHFVSDAADIQFRHLIPIILIHFR